VLPGSPLPRTPERGCADPRTLEESGFAEPGEPAGDRSIGIAIFPTTVGTRHPLETPDVALYSPGQGGNRYQYFHARLNRMATQSRSD
jgi:hypothetical protein